MQQALAIGTDVRVAQGVPDHRGHPAGDRSPALGARAARDLPGPVDARAGGGAPRRGAGRERRADATRCRSPIMVLLDQLSATERAVFLLHDVFGYRFDEVAADRRPQRGGLPPDRRAGAPPPRASTVRVSTATRGGARRSPSSSSPPFATATSTHCCTSSPRTPCSWATAAARRPRCPSRSTAATAWCICCARSPTRTGACNLSFEPALVNAQPGRRRPRPRRPRGHRPRPRHRRRRDQHDPLDRQPRQDRPPRRGEPADPPARWPRRRLSPAPPPGDHSQLGNISARAGCHDAHRRGEPDRLGPRADIGALTVRITRLSCPGVAALAAAAVAAPASTATSVGSLTAPRRPWSRRWWPSGPRSSLSSTASRSITPASGPRPASTASPPAASISPPPTRR